MAEIVGKEYLAKRMLNEINTILEEKKISLNDIPHQLARLLIDIPVGVYPKRDAALVENFDLIKQCFEDLTKNVYEDNMDLIAKINTYLKERNISPYHSHFKIQGILLDPEREDFEFKAVTVFNSEFIKQQYASIVAEGSLDRFAE